MTHMIAIYHRVDELARRNVWIGACACGWRGPDRPTKDKASADAVRHHDNPPKGT
jgi:hypothetical protein